MEKKSTAGKGRALLLHTQKPTVVTRPVKSSTFHPPQMGGIVRKVKNGGPVTEKADEQTQKPATDSYVILSNLKKSRKERGVKTISEMNNTACQIESQSEG